MLKSKEIVSVVISAYNASDTIEKTLISLENQDIEKGKFEVIVADDGSTDSTKSIVEKYIARAKINLFYYYQKKAGVWIVRNYGISQSSWVVLAFTDADCICDTNWVSTIYTNILEKWHKLIGGNTYSYDTIIFPWKMAPVNQVGITANLALDFRIIKEPKVFSGDFIWMVWEDTDLVLRLESRGIKLVHIPEMRINHPAVVQTLKKTLTRFPGRANYVLLYKRHRERVLNSFSYIFRPIIFGRVCLYAVLNILLAILFIYTLVAYWVVWLVWLCIGLFIAFFLYFYKFAVIYMPAGSSISAHDKIKTFYFLVLVTPLYFYYRIQGVIKFRFFML